MAGRRIALLVPCARWTEQVPEARPLCRSAARAAFAIAGRRRAAAIGEAVCSLLLADDTTLKDLNKRYRGIDRPTNVLSFPAGQGESYLGDIAIAFETADSEARAAGKPLADHLAHLVVHGVLHLLGYDHMTASEAEAMEGLERGALARLGIADPYEGTEAA